MSEQRKATAKRLATWGGGGLLLVVVLALALKPRPAAVDLAEVTRGPLRVTVDEEGETRVRERFVVSAPLPGRLLRIELEPGDPVRAGDTVLATFRPSDPVPLDARSRAQAAARVAAAEAALGRARAERERAAAELRRAEAEHARYERLAGDQIASAERLEEAVTTVEVRRQALEAAEFAVRNAGHELAAARAALVEAGGGNPGAGETLAIRSPVDGVVLQCLRESEAVVPAGEPLVEVGDPAELEIVSDLLSTDAVRVRPGQRVIIDQWGGAEPLAGVVRRVEPYGFTKISALGVEEQRVNVIIDFDGPPAHAAPHSVTLGDGYRVEVRIVVWEADDVLKAPTSSLFRHGHDWAVWVAAAGRATLRPIRLGVRGPLEAQVLDGLTAGEQVIVHPSDAITDGTATVERG